MKKILKIEPDEEINIITSKNKGIKVTNINNDIVVKEVNETICENVYIKSLSYT